MDVSLVVQGVTGVAAAVGAVGGAKLGIDAAIESFKHLREMIGVPAYSEFMATDGSDAAARQDEKDHSLDAGYWHTIEVNGVKRDVWIERDFDDDGVVHE